MDHVCVNNFFRKMNQVLKLLRSRVAEISCHSRPGLLFLSLPLERKMPSQRLQCLERILKLSSLRSMLPRCPVATWHVKPYPRIGLIGPLLSNTRAACVALSIRRGTSAQHMCLPSVSPLGRGSQVTTFNKKLSTESAETITQRNS